ncbi:MAG TPA: 30S ribosome-binding factor RbfA [Verrucomicrobiae bacterium]
MASVREARVRELLKRALGEIIRREFPTNDYGVISVNDVQVSGDLQNATVFLSIIGTKNQKRDGEAKLQSERKHIQGLLGKEVVLRYTPVLRLVVDDSIERGDRVLQIIEELEKKNDPAS